MDRDGAFRSACKKWQRESDLPEGMRRCSRRCGNGFRINGIRCGIGVESESRPSKKDNEINMVYEGVPALWRLALWVVKG
jgi:hypothetical protein